MEEHANTASFSSRYLFNAKELDPETGRYYYGARYYDPGLSIWLSVDPLAANYPSLTPYNFVENNPMNLIDPDGRSAVCPDCPDNGEFVEQITSGEFYSYNSETGTTTRHPGEVLEDVTVSAPKPKETLSIPNGKPIYGQSSMEFIDQMDADHKEDGIDMRDFELKDIMGDFIQENIVAPILEKLYRNNHKPIPEGDSNEGPSQNSIDSTTFYLKNYNNRDPKYHHYEIGVELKDSAVLHEHILKKEIEIDSAKNH